MRRPLSATDYHGEGGSYSTTDSAAAFATWCRAHGSLEGL